MKDRFSQRYGHSPVKQVIQLDSMDSDLRNSLWNALELHFWQPLYSPRVQGIGSADNRVLRVICSAIWADYFKYPLDTLSNNWDTTKGRIRKYFFESHWPEVYDFIEFMSQFDVGRHSGQFEPLVNGYLEREVSGYRFVDEQITPITDPNEISEIELAVAGRPDSVSEHLKTALRLLSDRQEPDYRNSVKESISSVEAQVRSTLGVENGTLGDLLKQLHQVSPIHPALRTAFSTLYGYTSDESGIRHSLLEGGRTVSFSEAKFMLVACSAFVNYVRGINVK